MFSMIAEEGKDMANQRQHVRHPALQLRKLAMTLIPFEKEENIEVVADPTDIGAGGLGITADRVLEPGYVIIENGKGEHLKGVLVWSKKLDDMTCRAGIQIIPMHLKAVNDTLFMHIKESVLPSKYIK
jgi:hypothetical protein